MSTRKICQRCGKKRIGKYFLDSVSTCKSCLLICKSLGCTKGAIDDIYCFDCREIKVQKNKRRREEWEESFKTVMTQYGSNLTAFGTSLISVSKGNQKFLLYTPLFSDTECALINEWISRSFCRIEAIDSECPSDVSRWAH